MRCCTVQSGNPFTIVSVIDGELLTIRVDLNSDDWLVPNPSPGTVPDFLFTGPTDFLDALAVTLP